MIAEIHGKISSTGSNLTERLEDKLTGDVFGRLRYIPFHQAIKHVLQNVYFENDEIRKQFHKKLNTINNLNYNFWPKYNIAELDLILDNNKGLIIGIEVKYNSGLSSHDMAQEPDQLIRESEELIQKSVGSGTYLIFLAKQVYVIYKERLPTKVKFGYLTWENVLFALMEVKDNMQNKEHPFDIILSDIIQLLKRKGFEAFQNFSKGVENEIIKEKYYHFK